MVPVHLPDENHWLLALISVLNVCMYTFTIPLDVLQQRTEQFLMPLKKDLSETNFSGFLMRIELHVFQEDNWDESTPQCPKQKNNIDCGVFTCLFAKHLLLSRDNHSGLTLSGEPEMKWPAIY